MVTSAWLALPQQASAQDPAYRVITTAEGLPSLVVYAVAQDRDGYLWFGTDAGACRFDGSSFTTFTTSDGLGDNEVLRVFADRQGRVWFLALNGNVSFYQNGTIHNAHTDPYLAAIKNPLGFDHCVEDDAGNLYFASIGGDAYRLNGEHVEHFQPGMVHTTLPGMVTLLNSPIHGVLALVGLSVYRFDKAGPQFLRERVAGPALASTVLSDGTPVEVSGSSMIYDLTTGNILCGPIAIHHEVNRLWADGNGGCWATCRTSSVIHVDPRTDRTERFFDGYVVNMAFEDRDHNVWFSTSGQGVLVCTREQLAMRIYRPSVAGVPSSPTCLMLEEDGCWMGTDRGGLYRLRDGVLGTVVTDRPNHRERVRSIIRDDRARILFTTDLGTRRATFRNGQPELERIHYYDPRSRVGIQDEAAMKSLAIGPTGKVYASAFALAELIDTAGLPTFTIRPSWCPELIRIYCLLPDGPDRLWYETTRRLRVLDHGIIRDFPQLDSLFGARITSLAWLDEDHIVVASAGGGVSIIRNGQLVKRIRQADGLCSDQCRKVIVDQGRIFLGTDAGACMITDPLNAPRIRRWTMTEGLPVNDVQDLVVNKSTMLLATTGGLCVVPLDEAEPKPSPALVFRSVVLDREERPDTAVFKFIKGISTLSLSVQALVFAGREALKYGYRIGTTGAWIAMDDPFVTFSDLPLGQHRIELRAQLAASEWGRPIGIDVYVTAPWYATGLARTGMALGLLSMGLLLAWMITQRRVRAQQRILERETAIAGERQRIAADMHDDLGAEISSLMMSARSARSGQHVPMVALADLVEERTKGMMDKIDEILWSLDPESDTLLSTITFIQRYAEEFAAVNGLRFLADVRGVEGMRPMNASVRRALYLTIKEALRNVAQHAQAGGLRLVVHVEGGLRLVIKDDGKGLTVPTDDLTDRQANGEGHGLVNMRERIERIGGRLTFNAPPEGGTEVIIELPPGYE